MSTILYRAKIFARKYLSPENRVNISVSQANICVLDKTAILGKV